MGRQGEEAVGKQAAGVEGVQGGRLVKVVQIELLSARTIHHMERCMARSPGSVVENCGSGQSVLNKHLEEVKHLLLGRCSKVPCVSNGVSCAPDSSH
jgi:hypothetical protein